MSDNGQENFDFVGDDELPDATKDELRDVTNNFFDRPFEKAEDFDWDEFRRNETFKAIMMPSRPFWVLANFERSFTQKLGSQMYEQFARAVADANPDVGTATRRHKITNPTISPEQQSTIENILQELEDGTDPDWQTERQRLLNAGGTPTITLSDQTWDIHVGDCINGHPLCAEIKSPKPNKDQTLAAKRKMLLTIAIYTHRDEPTPRPYFAFPFNPYGTRENYSHWPAKNVFDISDSNCVLIGEEFWDTIGGDGTMDGLYNFLLEESEDNLSKLHRMMKTDD